MKIVFFKFQISSRISIKGTNNYPNKCTQVIIVLSQIEGFTVPAFVPVM